MIDLRSQSQWKIAWTSKSDRLDNSVIRCLVKWQRVGGLECWEILMKSSKRLYVLWVPVWKVTLLFWITFIWAQPISRLTQKATTSFWSSGKVSRKACMTSWSNESLKSKKVKHNISQNVWATGQLDPALPLSTLWVKSKDCLVYWEIMIVDSLKYSKKLRQSPFHKPRLTLSGCSTPMNHRFKNLCEDFK